MRPLRTQIVRNFSREAKRLRAEFDARLGNPLGSAQGRFVWDAWHVPEQYSLLRTPAYEFFSPALYARFHNEIVHWGRENLGCHDISPTWMSAYTEGHYQDWHGDLPHGPFAFVFSLTPWSARRFSGGETCLLRDEALDLWNHLDRFQGMERKHLIEEVAPKFNQLLVFDGRIPHRVSRVRGVSGVTEGRLVIHGWFVNPRPYISGSLSTRALAGQINSLLQGLHLADPGRGVVTLRFRVDSQGAVTGVKLLAHTLRPRGQATLSALVRAVKNLRFGRQKGVSTVTLPIQFGAP